MSDLKTQEQKISDHNVLMRQLRDYCQIGIDLVWQRQIIFLAALGLAAFYYDLGLAISVLFLICLSEVFDFCLFRQFLRCQACDARQARRFLILICFSTVFSASIIIIYSISIAILQGPTTHFMPLFFLFAAALFAAMNNHQLLPVLFLRLSLYGVAFLFIPIRDLVITQAPLSSELWAQLFTSIFVVFFIIDSSVSYLKFYRSQLAQLAALTREHELSLASIKAKTEFVSTMSHELRTPLTAIKGAIDLIKSGKLGEMPTQAEAAITIAQRNSDRLLSLINEILDLQSVENNSMRFEFAATDLVEVVKNTVLDNAPYTTKLGVEMVTDLPSTKVLVDVDRKRLGQVFSNIISNASKFSPSGSKIIINFEIDQDQARVLFSDKGIGLSEGDYDKVFDPFSQIDASDTRKIGGTGLGMNISKRIMDAMGGTIRYQRNTDVGTTFIVELPRELREQGSECPSSGHSKPMVA